MAQQQRSSPFHKALHGGAKAGLLAALFALSLAANAGPLADPTRPPSAQGAATGQRGPLGAGTRPAAAPLVAPVVVAPLPLPLLQSVQLPSPGPTQGLALAMIEGQPVRAGDTVAGRLVLSIDSQGLVLRGVAGPERLWLLDGTPKQAPGSILTTRSARYVPAAVDGETTAGTETSSSTERTARSPQASAVPARPATTGPLSLAGKNAP